MNNFDIYKLTPVEEHGGITFKREDKFAPFGYGNINGSKLRQCVYLIENWKDRGIVGVVSGGVSESPQHAFISAVCKDFGLSCIIVTAKKEVEESKYLKIAKNNGTKFVHSKVGYAKSLNSQAEKICSSLQNHKVLEVNITLDEKKNSYKEIARFHEIGAYQVQNIPYSIDTIIIPCGSCNSVTSILFGLIKYNIKNIKKLVFLGIGNNGSNNINYVNNRLKRICIITGHNYSDWFDFTFKGDSTKKVQIDYFDLNGSGYCQYSDLMPASIDSINFHPRYEGKCINYLQQSPKMMNDYWKPTTLFWIVGSDISTI